MRYWFLLNRIFSLTAFVSFAVLSLFCFKWGAAAWYAKASDDLVSGWVETTYIQSPEEIILAMDYNNRAQELEPDNPGHHFTAAQLFEWRGYLQRKSPGYWKSNIQAAEQEYRWIIGRLPASGYAWISLAESLMEQKIFSDDVTAAIQHAIRLGPWDPMVLRRLVHLGMKHWEQLPGSLRRETEAAVSRALAIPHHHFVRLEEHVFRTAIAYKWEDNLRKLITTDAHLSLFQRIQKRNS